MSSPSSPLPDRLHGLPLPATGPEHPDDRSDRQEDPRRTDADLDGAYRTHGGSLLRFLRREAGAAEAPDLVQEVFMRAAGSDQQHSLANPGGFLHRIAQNLLIDRARRRHRQPALLLPLEEHHDAVSPPQQEWNMAADDLLRLYEAAVDAMPPKTRRVFLMHRVDELSYREIHERVGISIATVEYHMMKALAHIAKAVDHDR